MGRVLGDRRETVRTICFGSYNICTRWRRGGSSGIPWGAKSHPNNTSTIEDVVAAISSHPHWDELLVTGNFNAYLVDP